MATNSAAASGPLLQTRHKGLLTLGIMLAMMMQILDTTIANVALPHMQTSLGAQVDTITWVLTSYIVASAVAIPITGWLADRIGSRQLFLIAVAIFIVTSMMCGAATSLEQMVLFRILQGISAAFIGPLSQTAMLDINATQDHGKAMAIWSLGAVLGPVLGPLIGGWLTESYNWRWVFYVNLPIGMVTFAILFFLLPSREKRRRGFDMFGFAFFALGIAALQLMLDRGQQLDWFDSWEIWIGGGLAVIGLWVFVFHLMGGGNTIISRDIFRDRNFNWALFFIFVVGIVIFTSLTLLGLMLQGIFGYSVYDAGLVLAPRGIGVIIAMAVATRLLAKIDPRILLAAGFGIIGWTFGWMAGWSLQIDSWTAIYAGIVQGFGIGFVLVLLNTVAFTTLPQQLRAEASSLLNLLRNVGASVGISLAATYIARIQQISHADLATNVSPQTLPTIGLEGLRQYGLNEEAALMVLDSEINRQALMIAYVDNYWALMVLSLAMVPLSFLLKKLPTAPPPTEDLAEPEPEPAE